MPFEGFPFVLKPPVNADLIGYNIGNIVTNHKTAFFVSTNHRAYTWHRHTDIQTSCKLTPWSGPQIRSIQGRTKIPRNYIFATLGLKMQKYPPKIKDFFVFNLGTIKKNFLDIFGHRSPYTNFVKHMTFQLLRFKKLKIRRRNVFPDDFFCHNLTTAQFNSTVVSVDKVISWTTTTTHPLKLLRHFQTPQEAHFRDATLF